MNCRHGNWWQQQEHNLGLINQNAEHVERKWRQRFTLYHKILSFSRLPAPLRTHSNLMDTIPLSSWWRTFPKVESVCPTQMDPTHTSTLIQWEDRNGKSCQRATTAALFWTPHIPSETPPISPTPPLHPKLLQRPPGFIARRSHLSAGFHCSFLYMVYFYSFLMAVWKLPS